MFRYQLSHSKEVIYQTAQAPYQLSVSFRNIDPDLRDQRIGKGKLGQGETGDGKLADADNTDAELGKSKNPAGKLPDGNETYGGDRSSCRTVFE